MNIENLRDYCLSKKCTTESFPFDDNTLVFKLKNKMFALTNLKGDLTINLKCEPEKAIELREHYTFVHPGYHMNKKHWNTIDLFNTLEDNLVKEWIDDSYNLVLKSLSKKLQKEILESKE
jgi:predicted DNA-binding protein (MmcQ/YjbR family)